MELLKKLWADGKVRAGLATAIGAALVIVAQHLGLM